MHPKADPRAFKCRDWLVRWDEAAQQWKAVNERYDEITGAHEILAALLVSAQYRRNTEVQSDRASL